MIHIEMNTKRLKLTVKGHAQPTETSEGEYKPICTAASAIAQGLVWALARYREGSVLDNLEYKNDPGDLLIRILPEKQAVKEAEGVFELYGYALELLAKAHPQSVEMIWDGRLIQPFKEQPDRVNERGYKYFTREDMKDE